MMKKNDPMSAALAKRRGNGIDLNIMIGPHPGGQADMHEAQEATPMGKDDNEKNGLAPSVKDKMIQHEEKELQMMKSGTLPPEMLEAEQQEMKDYGPMMEGVTDYDKERLMKEEPKSLGQRARRTALEGMSKK